MSTSNSFSFAQQQLLNLPDTTSLVILHPAFYGQHPLLAPFLSNAHVTPVFFSVPEPGLSFAELLVALRHTLQDQLETDVAALPNDPQQAADTIAHMMLRRKNVALILDAYDLLVPGEITPFSVALARQLTHGCRLVIGTRVLPMVLVEHEDLIGKTAVVPVNPHKMMLDYTESVGHNVLEVRALGQGRVLINGRLVDHWDGVLPRMLFFYFVDRGMTTRDEIFRTFWPTLSTREATNVFHVTKRKISEILGTDLTVYWSGFYRISPDLELHYDVVKFAEAIQNADVVEEEEAIYLLRNAISLYGGPFLSMTTNQPWAAQRRDELVSSYTEALAMLARIYRQQDALFDSLGFYLRAAATSPQREDLARSIMELYRDLNRPADALDTYHRLELDLKRGLGVAPSPQTTELAKHIRAKMK